MSTAAYDAVKALVEQIDGPVASFFTSCVHCGMCADACLFYTESQDPKYTPIYKLLPMRKVWQQELTFWGRLMKSVGITKPITHDQLAQWEELVYDSCTLCGRCSQICPVGNDITYMIRKFREGMVAAGHAPQGLKEAMRRAIELGGPMGVTLKTLQAQITHAEKELGYAIPVDQEGADYMMLLSSAEIVQFHEIVPAVARIFKQTGVTWTFCSDAFEGTNTGVQIGAADLAAELVERIIQGAERLKVKTVITPECGHAYMALRWEGPNLVGRPLPFKVMHILEVLDDLRQQGKLKVKGKDNTRMTFHDPCQTARRAGLVQQPRNLIDEFASDFVEMTEHGEYNWCCGGGGGVGANERADELRLDVFSRKKKQLDEINVDCIVTACSNCRNMLEDGLEHYHMDNIEVVGLTETLAKYLDEPQ
jgi:Fe-S oxidoreductase